MAAAQRNLSERLVQLHRHTGQTLGFACIQVYRRQTDVWTGRCFAFRESTRAKLDNRTRQTSLHLCRKATPLDDSSRAGRPMNALFIITIEPRMTCCVEVAISETFPLRVFRR
jgi:hypothetical protein